MLAFQDRAIRPRPLNDALDAGVPPGTRPPASTAM